MPGLFESLFKKKPQYDIESLRKEALRDLEENFHPRSSVMFSIMEQKTGMPGVIVLWTGVSSRLTARILRG